MKKLCLLIFPLIIIYINVNAQGNLQFNKVKLVGSQIDTVPSGKVWKVESIMPAGSTYSIRIQINSQEIYITSFYNQTIYMGYTPSGIAMSDAQYTKLPFWLPEGTTLSYLDGFISLIEFNIIQ